MDFQLQAAELHTEIIMGQSERDSNCIFCKIIAKKIPATTVSESADYIAIRDISPQAPTHILVIPNKHVTDIRAFEASDALGKLFQAAAGIAKQEQLESFRLVVNTGADAGQTVFHLHIHVLGGRAMQWPPG